MKDGLDSIRQILKKYETALLSYPNVTSVGIGYKRVENKETEELCVLVYVKKKVSKDELDPKHVIPMMLENVPTDIVESDCVIFHGYG